MITFLLCLRNGKWKFLEGVKISGAPLPRKVIMQQCLRDMGVLEALCNYVSLCTTCLFVNEEQFYKCITYLIGSIIFLGITY